MISAKDAKALRETAENRLSAIDTSIREAASKGKSFLDLVLNCYEKELLTKLGYAPTKIDSLTRIYF